MSPTNGNITLEEMLLVALSPVGTKLLLVPKCHVKNSLLDLRPRTKALMTSLCSHFSMFLPEYPYFTFAQWWTKLPPIFFL
jgi:hypothetical protein